MSKIFKPRRILKSKAASLNPVLAAGEYIVEVPDTGVGTGPCRTKMGDGKTAYVDLPYMDAVTDVAASTIAFDESTTADNATLLTEIVTGKSVKSLFGSTKKLLSNLAGSVTELNNKYDSFNEAKSSIISSALGKALGIASDATMSTVADKIRGVVNRGTLNWNGNNTTASVSAGYYTGGTLDSKPSYNSGRSQGQSDVKNNPNGYGLYTKSQYDSNWSNGYNSGYSAAAPSASKARALYYSLRGDGEANGLSWTAPANGLIIGSSTRGNPLISIGGANKSGTAVTGGFIHIFSVSKGQVVRTVTASSRPILFFVSA